jgi:hypothetical protein
MLAHDCDRSAQAMADHINEVAQSVEDAMFGSA